MRSRGRSWSGSVQRRWPGGRSASDPTPGTARRRSFPISGGHSPDGAGDPGGPASRRENSGVRGPRASTQTAPHHWTSGYVWARCESKSRKASRGSKLFRRLTAHAVCHRKRYRSSTAAAAGAWRSATSCKGGGRPAAPGICTAPSPGVAAGSVRTASKTDPGCPSRVGQRTAFPRRAPRRRRRGRSHGPAPGVSDHADPQHHLGRAQPEPGERLRAVRVGQRELLSTPWAWRRLVVPGLPGRCMVLAHGAVLPRTRHSRSPRPPAGLPCRTRRGRRSQQRPDARARQDSVR